jgi:hypothetical protein
MSKIREKIRNNIQKWERNKTLAEYARQHFSQVDNKNNKIKIENIFENIYRLATSAKSGAMTKILAAKEIREILLSSEERKETTTNTQINFYANATAQVNESITKLIEVNSSKNDKNDIKNII